MGIFWSTFWPSPPRQNETISRQNLQQSTLKEIAQMEHCIHCYQDSRLGLLLGPYVRQNFPWDTPPYCYNPLHLKYSRNYRPKGCYHCPKGQFQDHASRKILDGLFGKITNRCQCTAPVPDIDLQQYTEDEDESDINENI